MSTSPIAANLRRQRRMSKKTQEELANLAGLSLAGYRKIERDLAVPRASTLRALAAALDVPVSELVRPEMKLSRVRFRSQKKLKSREHVLAEVGQRLADYSQLEETLGEHEPFELLRLGGRPSVRRAVEAAAEARDAMGLGRDEPIRDVCGLLESNGVKVLTVPMASDGFFGLSVGEEDGGPAVVVNTWERISIERQIFTAAHELGHLVLHFRDYDVAEKSESPAHEKQANVFASHFLMPEGIFRKEWDQTWGLPFLDRVLKVKRRFRVSYATVLHRIAEGSSDPQLPWKQFDSQYRDRYRRGLNVRQQPSPVRKDQARCGEPASTGEPEKLSQPDFLPERLHGLVRSAVEKGLVSMSRAAEILGLAIVEMRQLTREWAT